MINAYHVLIITINCLLGRLRESVIRNVQLKNIEIPIIIHVWGVMIHARNVLGQLIMIVLSVIRAIIKNTRRLVLLANASKLVLQRNSEDMMELAMLALRIVRNARDRQRICVCHVNQTFS